MHRSRGPWVLDRDENLEDQWVVESRYDGAWVAETWGEGNARLVAAAPELLTTLQDLCEVAQSAPHACTPTWVMHRAMRAIAKATGSELEV